MQSTRLRKCKVGNWQEEVAFELDRKAMVSKAREQAAASASASAQGAPEQTAASATNGSSASASSFFALSNTAAANTAILSAQIVAKRDHHLQPAALGTPIDGYITFGSPLLLQSAETDGILSVDLHDRNGLGKQMKIAATTTSNAQMTKPVLRSTWVLLPVPEDIEMVQMRNDAMRGVSVGGATAARPMDPNLVLHYGQRFILCSLEEMAIPACHGDAPGCVFLASEATTPQARAKRAEGQEVFFTPHLSQKCWWTVQHANPDFRADMELTPVKASSVFLMRHQLTATPLASSKTMYPNDFGAEYEVCARRHLRVRVKNGNALETDANFWSVTMGQEEEMSAQPPARGGGDEEDEYQE